MTILGYISDTFVLVIMIGSIFIPEKYLYEINVSNFPPDDIELSNRAKEGEQGYDNIS